jgi:hypothetical protein
LLKSLFSQSLFEWLKFGVSFGTLVSIVVAYLAYRANVKKNLGDRIRDQDKELLVQCEKSFSWAFDALTGGKGDIPPKADRLNWLTCSRHLLRCQKLSRQMLSPTYLIIYAEIEEFWRHKFYTVLSHEQLRNWSYYADTKNSTWPENIQISSALVIVDFSNWKQGLVDPTDTV